MIVVVARMLLRLPGDTLKRATKVTKKLIYSETGIWPALYVICRTSTILSSMSGSISLPAITINRITEKMEKEINK